MMKPKFIKSVEKEMGFLSIMSSYDRDEKFVQSFLQKKHHIVFAISNFTKEKKPNYSEIILKTAQPFYIHLIKKDNDWAMDIYYLPENYKELLFFINQIEKV